MERHNKPEVEVKSSKEVLLVPVTISRSDKERVYIEPSINSVRVSIAIKQVMERGDIGPMRYIRPLGTYWTHGGIFGPMRYIGPLGTYCTCFVAG